MRLGGDVEAAQPRTGVEHRRGNVVDRAAHRSAHGPVELDVVDVVSGPRDERAGAEVLLGVLPRPPRPLRRAGPLHALAAALLVDLVDSFDGLEPPADPT